MHYFVLYGHNLNATYILKEQILMQGKLSSFRWCLFITLYFWTLAIILFIILISNKVDMPNDFNFLAWLGYINI